MQVVRHFTMLNFRNACYIFNEPMHIFYTPTYLLILVLYPSCKEMVYRKAIINHLKQKIITITNSMIKTAKNIRKVRGG